MAELGDRGLLALFAAGLHVEFEEQDVAARAHLLHLDRPEAEASSALGADVGDIETSPDFARMSTCVPPAKSMPKFMPTNRNISTETIDRTADSG